MSTLRRTRPGQRYNKSTEGWNAQGFFSPNDNDAYATSANLADFAYAAASLAGTVGIYNADTGALITGAITTEDVLITQKNTDGDLKRSTILTAGNTVTRKIAVSDPERDAYHVGYNGVGGDLNISIVGGLQEFVLSARAKHTFNQPFPVQEGRVVIRGGAPTDYDIASKLASSFNSGFDYEENGDDPIAVANVLTDIAGSATIIVANYTFNSGRNEVYVDADVTADATVGDYIVDTAPTPNIIQKMTSVSYDAGSGLTTIITDYAYQGGLPNTGPQTEQPKVRANTSIGFATQVNVDAALVGVEVVGYTLETILDVSVSEDLGDADIAKATTYNQGSGWPHQVAPMEDECMVFDGWTTVNEAWIRDFGVPDIYVDELNATDRYVLYITESTNRVLPSAGAPQNQTLMKSNVIVAALSGSDLETNLDTIFGV